MDTKEFKSIFNDTAINYGFDRAFGGWFKETSLALFVLDLQKSNYGNYYEVNIKIFVQNLFGDTYQRHKDLVKKQNGNIFRRLPATYDELFNLDSNLPQSDRENGLNRLFTEFLVPFFTKASSVDGIFELEKEEQIFITPSVKAELLKR